MFMAVFLGHMIIDYYRGRKSWVMMDWKLNWKSAQTSYYRGRIHLDINFFFFCLLEVFFNHYIAFTDSWFGWDFFFHFYVLFHQQIFCGWFMFIFTCFLSFFTYLVLLFLSIVILGLYSLIHFIPPVCYVVESVSLWKVFFVLFPCFMLVVCCALYLVSSSHHEQQIRRNLALPMQFSTTATQLCHHVISPKTKSAALLYLTCLLPSSCCPSVGEIYLFFMKQKIYLNFV